MPPKVIKFNPRRRGWSRPRSRPRPRLPGGKQRNLGLIAFAVLVGAVAGALITGKAPGSADAATGELSGHARVVDGDTLVMAGERIRLSGADAPERDQSCEDGDGAAYPCGQVAADALRGWIAGRTVECQRVTIDNYGRMVARCSVEGEDVASWLVRHGHAVDYTRYSHGRYLADEVRARREHTGIWAGTFTRPEDWRHARR